MFKKIIIDDICKTVENNKKDNNCKEHVDYEIMVNEHLMRKPRFNKARIITYLILLVILAIVLILLFG